MQSGARRWGAAPGGICVRRGPMRAAQPWEVVAERLRDAVGAQPGRPPALRGEAAMPVQLAAQRGGAGNPV